ncbi:MAG: Ig-like domain-containing protein [Rhodothermales bacterium]
MRYYISSILTALFIAGTMAGCDLFTGDSDSGPVTLTGLVINSVTNDPVTNAFVRVLPNDELGETDELGRYSIVVDVDSTMDVDLTVTKSGFVNQTTSVLAVADRTIEVATVRLVPVEGGTDPTNPGGRVSGRASNILLLSQSVTSIGVRESGSQEVAELIFQATDSLGRPVTLDNQVTINFSFGANPGGDAFIFPESAQTNENGEVRTNISSGLVAGVVQVVATTTLAGRVIRSLPVPLAIHGGLPDSDHFGIATSRLNVPRAWDFWGTSNTITAFVGDQFGNPVRVGTSVYFTASAGIIGGSNQTGALGTAPIEQISGPPQPVHPEFGNGYVIVTGSTADRNQNEITDDILVLFSGSSNIIVPSGQGPIVLGNAYEFLVYDQNQNPLGEGTNIVVIANGTNVEAFGNTNTVLPDMLFGDHNNGSAAPTYGRTRFSFGYQQGEQTDQNGDLIPPVLEAITIRVTGPNGNAERVILQNGGVLKRDENGKMVRDDAGDGVEFIR